MTAALYVVTALLTLVWLGLLFRALLADRSRGRRRCPKCFYEIDQASGFKCSECGRTAKNEPALAKTHRHWGRAMLVSILILTPALLTGGIARFQQTGGWSDLPAPIITRLLWLDIEELDDEVLLRISRGEIEKASAERIVLAACKMIESKLEDRRTRGFAFLERVGYNNMNFSTDRPDTPRPMLKELRADVSVPLMIAIATGDDANDASDAVAILARLRDVDVDVILTLLRSIAHDDAAISAIALQEIGRIGRDGPQLNRLPFSPHTRKQGVPIPREYSRDDFISSFADEVAAQEGDHKAMLAWVLPIAQGVDESADATESETHLVMRRALAIWLACRLDGYSDQTWPLVQEAAAHESALLRIAAIGQASGFSWSNEVEEVLRASFASDDPPKTALRVAAKFGNKASGLAPDFLGALSRLDRSGPTAWIFRDFVAMGGEPKDLNDALVDQLEDTLIDQPRNALKRLPNSSSTRMNYTVILGNPKLVWDLELLAEIGVNDKRAADLMLAYMEQRRGEEAELIAAIAYAAITGDKAHATRTILARSPDLSKPLAVGSTQFQLWNLMVRDLADIDLIDAHYVETDDASRRSDFANLMAQWRRSEFVERFETSLRKLENDADPATAAAATKALQDLDK